MPNGRISKCVIEGRKSTELYHNTSGNAASVSFFANAISTDKNSEMTVVVGIASTTLAALTTKMQCDVGTFKSMTAPMCYTSVGDFVGVNTYTGFTVPPTEEYNQPNKSCTPGVGGNCLLNVASYPVFHDTYGCRTNEQPCNDYINRSSWICMCENTCIYGKLYGGNEIQNPAIWMREYPTFCHNCCGGDWLWAHKFVGVIWNNCCNCCWIEQPRCSGSAGTWYPITARQVGMGNSTNARQNALQKMINWCCECGCLGGSSTQSGMAPITKYSGCETSNGCRCRWGTHCNMQMCKVCACHCCAGGGWKMWNWYALDRSFYCCCDNFTNADYACFKSCYPTGCAAIVDEGKFRTPLWMTFMWCCNCACGCVLQGNLTTWYPFCQACCGCLCWQHQQDLQVSSCQNRANWICQHTKCFCHPCCGGLMASPSQTRQRRMSPHGFAFGMTNCAMMIYSGHDTTGSVTCHRYLISYPAICYFRTCQDTNACYWYQRFRLDIQAPTLTATYCNEFPVKYLAWNCFKQNKSETMGCTYIMIRSQSAAQCGIFSLDANDMRVSHGPFCGYTGTGDTHCCGTLVSSTCFSPDGFNSATGTAIVGGKDGIGAKLTKVADFPTEMAETAYSDGKTQIMCTSCLFRADFCTWTMSVYNYTCSRWDGFQSNDLISWKRVTDCYSLTVSNVLTTFVTSDNACIVDDCNCYFANIDCTGIIDYKLSVNQYERTGIVLSNNDRIMVNNDADVCLNFQVWGYEG